MESKTENKNDTIIESKMEGWEEKRVEKEQKRHRRSVVTATVIFCFLVLALAGFLINGLINREYCAYEIVNSRPRQDSSTVKYMSYNDSGAILKYSRDGASAMDSEGNILWNGSYEFNNPVADVCRGYVVIADVGGKEAYVFNGSDSGTKITTVLPILEAEVASQGVVALVLEEKDSNEIQIINPYETENSLLVKIPTNIAGDGYPVDISISEDGKKLVTTYIALENGELKSKVTFYNFGEIGKDRVNNIVGGVDFGKDIVAHVEFLDNTNICLMQEKQLLMYQMPELPEEGTVLTADGDIRSVLYSKDTIGYVAEEKLVLYSYSGNKKLELPVDWEYDEAEIINDDIIFRSELFCHVLRPSGSVKLDCRFDKNILYMFPTKKKNHYIFIDENNIEEVKLLEAAKQ